MIKTITTLAAAALLAGCATSNYGINWQPLIDGGDAAKIEVDLMHCQVHAQQVASSGQQALAGAIFGALVGAAVNAAMGGSVGGELAAAGAVTGAADGLRGGHGSQESVIRTCMIGRGHKVLN